MVSKTLTRAFAIVLALPAFLVSSPGLAADVSLREFARQELRLATIAFDISKATAGDCSEPHMITGLLLHDLSAYDPAVRRPVSRAFSLKAGVGVVGIVSGSPADLAGLKIDDEILSLNGVSVEDHLAIKQPRKSFRRAQKFSTTLKSALRDGPVELDVRRAGAIVPKTLSPQLGCGGEISLLKSSKLNAWSDGSRLTVTTRMMQRTGTDDELAFVVAHEMAHNILGHSEKAQWSLFGIRIGGKRQELAADYLAVRLMTKGGYEATAGIDFLRSVRRRMWWSVSLDHPGFGTRIKHIERAIAAEEHSPTPDAEQPPTSE